MHLEDIETGEIVYRTNDAAAMNREILRLTDAHPGRRYRKSHPDVTRAELMRDNGFDPADFIEEMYPGVGGSQAYPHHPRRHAA